MASTSMLRTAINDAKARRANNNYRRRSKDRRRLSEPDALLSYQKSHKGSRCIRFGDNQSTEDKKGLCVMHSNRQQRRREARQLERHSKNLGDGIRHLSRSGPMQIEIVPASGRFDTQLEPEIFWGLLQFTHNIVRGARPLCLTCDHEWLRGTPPPAAYAVVRTHRFFRDHSRPTVEMISGICTSCLAHPELTARILDSYREIWPQLRTADIHTAPSGVM